MIMTAITTVKKEKSNKYVQREQQDLHASVLRLGNMADLSPETFKRTSLLLDAAIQADPVRHERGGSTG